MTITIKYFGLIGEITNTNQESFTLTNNSVLKDLEVLLLKKYPKLKDCTYNIAINQKIVNINTHIQQGDEIAYLPPFAGG